MQKEIDVLKGETESDSKTPDITIHDMFTDPVLRKPLIISCMIMLAQQFSGINAVSRYLHTQVNNVYTMTRLPLVDGYIHFSG